MYQIKFGDYIIYDPRGANDTDKLIVRSPKVHLAVGAAGSISFIIEHDHPYIDNLTRMRGRLELLEDGEVIFRGRIVRDTKNFYLAKTIEAEGQLACLNDSVVPPHEFPGDFLEDEGYKEAAATGNVVEWYLGWLIDNHNAQVSDEQQIKVGVVTVTDSNNYIARSSENYKNTWETIKDKLPGSALGGYLLVRYDGDDTYLDYYAEIPTPVGEIQTVEFAKNLLDLSDDIYGGDVYTAILPVGSDGLTIEELPDETMVNGLVKSGKIIFSQEAVEKYGMITSLQTWKDVTLPENLKSKAAALLLEDGLVMDDTVTCKAADIHCIDGSVPRFCVGRCIQVVSKPHKMSGMLPLTELDIDILNPGNTAVSMGATVATMTDTVQQRQEKMLENIYETKKTIENLVQKTEARVVAIVADTEEGILAEVQDVYAERSGFESSYEDLDARIQVTENAIKQTVSEETFTSLKNEFAQKETAMSQTVEGLKLEIGTITNDGVKKVKTGKGYTFDESGLTISDVNSDVVNKVDNTGMYVSRYNGDVMLQANADGVVATDVQINNFLIIGKHARIEDYSVGDDTTRTACFWRM